MAIAYDPTTYVPTSPLRPIFCSLEYKGEIWCPPSWGSSTKPRVINGLVCNGLWAARLFIVGSSSTTTITKEYLTLQPNTKFEWGLMRQLLYIVGGAIIKIHGADHKWVSKF